MAKRTKRPASPYSWMRAVGAMQDPSLNLAALVPADFWRTFEAVTAEMLPSQRKVFSLYRRGVGVADIAQALDWDKRSVYIRLGEINRHFHRRLPIEWLAD